MSYYFQIQFLVRIFQNQRGGDKPEERQNIRRGPTKLFETIEFDEN